MSLKKVFSWLLLSVLLSFGMWQSSVNAFGGSGSREINNYTQTNIQVSNVGYGSSGMTSTWSWNGLANLSFRVYLDSAVQAPSLVYISTTFSHINSNDIPLCYSGDNYSSVLWCEVSRSAYNDAVSVNGIFYARSEWNNFALWNNSIVFNNSGSNVRVDISNISYTVLDSNKDYSSQLSQIYNRLNGGITDLFNQLDQVEQAQNTGNNKLDTIITDFGTSNNLLSVLRTEFHDGTCSGDSSYYGITSTNKCFNWHTANNVLAIRQQLVNLQSTETTVANNTTNISNYADEQRQANDNISDQSASDIDGTTNAKTESLLASAGGFATVLANVNPSNCRINGNMGHFDIGMLDMCQDSPPSFITIIGSLVMVVILVGLSYALVNQILNLVKEMRT